MQVMMLIGLMIIVIQIYNLQVMKKVVQYKKSTVLRRGASFLLDLIVTLLCFVFINAIATMPIIEAVSDYDETYEAYKEAIDHTYFWKKFAKWNVEYMDDETLTK